MTNKKSNLLAPFRRDRKRDFASGSGSELLKSKVIQILMTEADTPRSSGELPWRSDLGSTIHLLKHQRNDAVLAELARVHVRDALKRWMPDVVVTNLDIIRRGAELILIVQFRARNHATDSAEIVLT